MVVSAFALWIYLEIVARLPRKFLTFKIINAINVNTVPYYSVLYNTVHTFEIMQLGIDLLNM